VSAVAATPEAASTERETSVSPARRVRRAVAYVGSRLLTLLVSSFVIFVGANANPGDVVTALLGPRAGKAAIRHERHVLGLDHPMLWRYWHWLTGVVHGHFGKSVVYKISVGSMIPSRLGVTLFLVVYAMVLILISGLAMGFVGGAFPRLRTAVTAVTAVLLSIPAFVAAQLLIAVFALNADLFPVSDAGSGFTDRLWHLTLPAVALTIAWSAWLAQVTKAAIAEAIDAEHVNTARARAIAPLALFRRHVVRNSAVPIVTISALVAAGLFAGAVVVENAFSLPGLGSLLVSSVSSKDLPVIQAVSLIYVTIFITLTSLIDGLHRLLDPRIRTRRPR
jgi:peptide/nickel transport system permease protein